MKVILNASLGTSKKNADIQESGIRLYIRPTDRSHYFPELFTTEGEEINIVELVLETGVLEVCMCFFIISLIILIYIYSFAVV